MKKMTGYLQVLSAILLLFCMSCKKVEQALCNDPCSDIKICNIKSYTFPGFPHGDPANTATFTYDAYGNPLSVTNTVVATGVPNLVFRYDALHRLSEFIRPYANGRFESWYKYVYDASGRIAFDTTYVFGAYTPGAAATDYIESRLTTYTYDNTCRVIKTSAVSITGVNVGRPPFEQTYSYDAAGNLIKPGVTYDNKVNIHRTNKVFMFVDRDYSLNNPYAAPSYNAYGLPHVAGPTTSNPTNYFLSRIINNASFVYSCD